MFYCKRVQKTNFIVSMGIKLTKGNLFWKISK